MRPKGGVTMQTPKWDGRRWRIQARRDGKRFSFSCSTPGMKGRKECQRKYDQWFYGEGSGEKSVGLVCREFLEDVKARRGENSPAFELYERYIRLYIAPQCEGRKMCRMTLRDWQSVLNNARGQNKTLSEKTVRTLCGIIKGIIKFGYEDYQCEPLRGNLYIPSGHWKREKEILQKEDIRRLFEPSELFYAPLFQFLCVTGLRCGEGLGIQIGDIKGNRLIISRSVTASGTVSDCKNKNARRVIPLGDLALSILKKTIKRNEDLNLHTDWVFCSPDGSMGNQSTMRNHWNSIKKERGLPEHSTCYSLRHTFISLMRDVMPSEMVKSIVGHSASMDTWGTYGHYIDGEERKAASIIDLTLGDNLGDTESTTGGQNG